MNEVEVNKQGPITIIRLNRPTVRNAIDTATGDQLREAWTAFDEDETALVGIMTGSDEVFCAGADLNELEEALPHADKGLGPIGIGRMAVNKPTIAAVAGYAIAGGFDLSLWCDMCIADETAIFGYFERKVGVPMLNGGSKRLSEIIGLRRALDIIMTGRPVKAQEALQLGIVNAVVPKGEALARAIEIAEGLATMPQICLRSDRQAVYDVMHLEIDEALIYEARLARHVIDSGEPFEGVARFFAERRAKGGS